MLQRITRTILILAVMCIQAQYIHAQNFKKTNTGLEYAFIIDKPTSPKPEIGDLVRMTLISTLNNNIMYNSLVANKGKAVEYGVQKPAFSGDVIEAIMLMTPGDSMLVRTSAGPVFANAKQKLPPGINANDKVVYYIKLASIKTKAEAQKEMQAKMQAQMNAQMQAQKKQVGLQKIKDESALKAYFKKNNITPTKTASGLYYIIEQAGTGNKPIVGDNVTMNYRGTLLDGTAFDSNIDTAFQHVTPFKFKLGKQQVIQGWDEGIALFTKGTKAKLFIPSTLAYGAQARPGSKANPKGIPTNSSLIFDVELVDFATPVNEDVVLQDYFKTNNITATKTPSGMYYKINEEGTGDKAVAGKTVTMRYTGKLLDGTKFDSNEDSLFQHVAPFNFELGKGRVIRGWEEGIQLLKKGSKATFYIPSALAYGEQSMPGSTSNPKGIPAGSTLIFDVVLDDIKETPAPPQQQQVPPPTKK